MPSNSSLSSSQPKKWKRLRAPLSCDQCRIKKRKCNRQNPCERCIADHEECAYKESAVMKDLAKERRQARASDVSLVDNVDDHFASSSPFNPVVDITNEEERTMNSHQISTGPESLVWSTSSTESDVLTAPTTVFSPSMPTRISFNHTAHPTTPLAHLAVNDPTLQLISHAPFLISILDIFLREIDWIMDLLSDTRLHRLLSELPSQGIEGCSPQLSQALHVLALALVAITSQMCPTEVQAVLLNMDWPVPSVELTDASVIAARAYTVAISRLNDPDATGEPRDWPAEHFAASYLLRIYEKNDGRGRNTKENLLIDLYRLQQAGLHRQPLHHKSHIDWPIERDRLAYRLFWQYFDKDCVLSWSGKVGRVISTQRARMCLNDPFGHIQIDQLCRNDKQQVMLCSCKSTSNELILSAFVGGTVRLSAITSRFSDRAGRISSPLFNWPDDAEQLAHDFDTELAQLDKDVEMLDQRSHGVFKYAQKESLSLSIAHARSELAKTLCEAFAQTLLSQGTTSKATIDGILQRRRLNTAMALIVKAKTVTAKLASCSLSWIFCPMFVHEQIIVLLNHVTPFFIPPDGMTQVSNDSFNDSSRQYILKCMRNILLGRNILILLTRRNELARVKWYIKDVCSKVVSIIDQLPLASHHTEHFKDISKVVMDDELIMHSTNEFLRRIAPVRSNTPATSSDTQQIPTQASFTQSFIPVFEEPVANFAFGEEFQALFEDLPSLSQLFQL